MNNNNHHNSDYYSYDTNKKPTDQFGVIPNWAWQRLRESYVYKDSPEFRADILRTAESYAMNYNEDFDGGMSWAIDEIIMFNSDQFCPEAIANVELENSMQAQVPIRQQKWLKESPSVIHRRARAKKRRDQERASSKKFNVRAMKAVIKRTELPTTFNEQVYEEHYTSDQRAWIDHFNARGESSLKETGEPEFFEESCYQCEDLRDSEGRNHSDASEPLDATQVW